MAIAGWWLALAPAMAQDKQAAMVVDANNGNVMHAEQADEPRFPASLTKIMTLYMAFEAIEQGRASYATRLKISHEAASQPPTRLDLEPGETITLIDAMKALVTKSANDAAVAIAEHLGGSEARFARMMTDKARLFGMSRTTFRNASGLPDPGQVTTARDMIRLALRVHDDFPKHYQLFATRSFTYDGSTYRNHNNLLHRFQGTDGIKTGYTRASGFNLVSSVRRGGRHVVGVVFGGRTASQRDVKMQLLVSRALLQSSPYKTRRSAPVLVAAATPAQRPQPQPQPALAPAPPPQRFAVASAAVPVLRAPAETERPRPVLVPSRPRPANPIADSSSQWPVEAPAPVPAVRPQLARAHVPTADGSQRLAFAPRGIELSAPPAVADQRGAPPSTLQHQASALSGRADPPAPIAMAASQPPPPPRSAVPASPPRASDSLTPVASRTLPTPYAVRGPQAGEGTPASGGGFEIQIGAFGTAAEAERALANVRGSAGDLLRGSASRAVPVRKEAREVYRARFVGFDSRVAASTCLELRRRQIDCFVMRAE